jgi:phenylacetate-CoA ligase
LRIRAVGAVRQFQFVQTRQDTIELRLVVDRPLTAAENLTLQDLARTILGHPFRVECLEVAEIPRGPTGKYEEFLSQLPE